MLQDNESMINNLYANTPSILTPLAIQTLIVALGLIVLGILSLIREQDTR